MKQTPKGWPRLSSALFYDDAAHAIDWLCDAFGFEVRLRVEGDGGRIEHSELTYGDALIMVAQSGRKAGREHFPPAGSPKSVGGVNTQSLMLFVDDVDAHCERARAAGAVILDQPAVHDYGEDYWADRSYGAADIEGHTWWFTQRIRDPREG
ncbi:MAG: VOC family protein [Acidobacteria bacterium]|nr:VOC family protein [Acidobacteriota bacterium]